MAKWKKTSRRLFEELVCSSTRGVNLFRWIPLQRGIFSNYQIELLCHRGRVSFHQCWNNICWRKSGRSRYFIFSPLGQKSAEVFLLEWPLSYWNAPLGVLRCTQVREHGHKRVCQDVRKHKSTVTRGYARSMSGLFRHFPLSRSPLFLPHPNPNFLNPFNWGGHLIETGMWQLCQPCFKCKQSESRHLHTGEGHWDIWHIIHSSPPLFSDESIQCFSFLPQLTISVCMMFIFRTLLFVAFGHLPSFSSNPLRLCHRTTIISSKFVPWKLARSVCQMLGKNSVRGNWKQIHLEYAAALLWGDDKSQWGTYNGGEKAKLWFSTS